MSGDRPTRWLKLTVAYDGARYAGYQFQPSEPTIQAALQDAWRTITREVPSLTASGRTDAGVHAEGQVVGVETRCELEPRRLLRGLNALLPDDVVVRAVDPAPDGFHATHDAIRKTYRYQIHTGAVPPLFDRPYVWHYRAGELDAAAMGQGGVLLVGRHDFASLESAGSERSSTVRTITELTVAERAADGGQRIDITVTGDGFLYNMVRTIAGTLVEVGRGARPPEWVADVLAARNRDAAGPTAPAMGLVLERVDYA
ncbi:tRNA pseudouridine(38-40) synthase TruA [Botrimarina sp.]|uniref:tRNA pseudouridine(38-40) synthase TruA n=1 Tax=Botrimarina sp. TaxID=2795802 RepID=UPI0032EE1611